MSRRKTLRERLSERLAEHGVVVAPEDFQSVRGYYRINLHVDVYRWEARATYNGIPIWLSSFDKMTDCARFGVLPFIEPGETVTPREPFEVSQRPDPRSPA